MKLTLTLLACTSLTTFVLWPDQGRLPETALDRPGPVERTAPDSPLRTARTLVEPDVLTARTPEEASFLDSVPFGDSPLVPYEKRHAVTGVPPTLADVLPVIEWGIRTRGFADFDAAVEAAKHRVAPVQAEHLLGKGHPQFERAREVYEAYLPRFEELAPAWAEAGLRYRSRVFEEGLYHAWPIGQTAPPEAIGNDCSVQVTDGWKIWFAWERGVEPSFDAVHERHASLNREFHAEIDFLRTL